MEFENHNPIPTIDSIPPIQNILQTHPKYISPTLLGIESINTCNIDIPIQMISINVTSPVSTTITGAADNGANIDAISGVEAMKYYQQHIKTERRAFRVRTGAGYIWCKDYVPLTIRNGTKLLTAKLYIIWDLPYNYIIGRNTQYYLGWRNINTGVSTYHHEPEVLDELPDEDTIKDSDYPIKSPIKNKNEETPNIDKINISDRDPELKAFIINQLKMYHKAVIAKHEWDIGKIPNAEFAIKFKNGVNTDPIQCNEYPHSLLHTKEVERQLRYLRSINFISYSTSPWRFPTFIVLKKNGEARIVFDYRLLNAITERMSYPLPSIEQLVNKFRGKEFISTIDIKSGYWHIPIKPEDRPKTAFVFNGKLYEWNVMPFGPTNAPPYFQKVMNDVFDDMPYVMVYMDDITIASKTAKEHQQHLKSVFDRLQKYGIKIRPDKCSFADKSIEYLGFIVDGNGFHITDKYKSKIKNIPIPKTKKQLQRFIGLVQYLHKFIPALQLQLAPFHKMIHKNCIFTWNDDCDQLFLSIKNKIQKASFLVHPNMDKEFEVYCDASIDGLGAVLAQRDDDGQLKVVQFSSKLFNSTQRNWHVSEQEIYAVIHAVEKWRPYLIGKRFTVYTDHKNLEELFNRAKNFKAGKLYRWAVRLQDFDFVAKYIKGSKNIFADYLSRDALLSTLPNQDHKQHVKTYNIMYLYTKHVMSSTLQTTSIGYTSNSILPNTIHTNTTTTHSPNTKSGKFGVTKNPHQSTISTKDSSMLFLRNEPSLYPFKALPWDQEIDSGSDDDEDDDVPIISHKAQQTQSKPNVQITHQYPTRYQKKQQQNVKYQQNLHTQLTQIPFSNKPITVDDDFDAPTNDLTTIKIQLKNDEIIRNKPSETTYNKQLLKPPNVPILDLYNMDTLTQHHIQSKQIDDPRLFPIIQYLQHNNRWLLQDLKEMDKYLYNMVLAGRYYLNKNNVLMYKYKHADCIVIPNCLRNSVLRWGHSSVHDGQDKMLLKILSRYWWIGMREDIKLFTQSCHGCQSVKEGRNTRYTKSGKMNTYSAKAPFELVSIDICGPLPQTSDGNRYIVSMIDKFSRFCLLTPVKDIRTMTIINAYEKWISLFGPPATLLSDNGSQFISKMFKNYTKSQQTKQRFSTPYYPEGNGQIERLHRWIKERLTLISIDLGMNFVDGDDDWDKYIYLIQHAYNSTPNTMTKYSPNKIVLGKDCKIILDELDTDEITAATPAEYIRMMHNNRKIITNNANVNQSKYDQSRIRTYNKNRYKEITYQVGDIVLSNIRRRLIGNKAKFTQTWTGPFEIIEIVNNNQYKIRNIDNNNVEYQNVKFLKPYTVSPYTNLMNRAMTMIERDNNDRDYQKIIDYAQKKKKML